MRLGRNYFILFVVYVFTIFGVFYFSRVYSNSVRGTDVSFFNELVVTKYSTLYDNVYNYGLEHPSFKIYVAPSFDVDNEEVLFIDANKISDRNLNKLISDFGYCYYINKESAPFYIVFYNGSIKEIYSD